MDRELMNALIEQNTHMDTINPVLKEDNSNIDMFFCADVVGNKRFAQNYGGYPRSEIAEINAAATMQEQAYLLAQLQDYSPDSNPNVGLTDAEIMLGHKSKYLQTPSETVSWLENQLHIREQRRKAEDVNKAFDCDIDKANDFNQSQNLSDNE